MLTIAPTRSTAMLSGAILSTPAPKDDEVEPVQRLHSLCLFGIEAARYDKLGLLVGGGRLARGEVHTIRATLAEAKAVAARSRYGRCHIHLKPLPHRHVVEHRTEL